MSDISAVGTDRSRFLPTPNTPTPAPAATKPKDGAAVLAASSNATPLDAASVASAKAAVHTANLTAKNDAFFEAAHPAYTIKTPSGEVATARAPAQFRMVDGMNYHSELKYDPVKNENVIVCSDGPPLLAALGPAGAKLMPSVNRVLTGRGTSEDVRAVTQALIDRGKLGPVTPADAPAAIQALQWKYGIGVDCAGYTQRAFFAARGMTGAPSERAMLGLNPLPANENFSGLPTNPRFKSVTASGCRVGDVLLLGPPSGNDVGHVVLVRSNAVVGASEEAKMGIAKGTFTGPVRRVDVDSSWGAGALGKGGGVQRRTWLYDEGTGKWASWDPQSKQVTPSTASGPYDHPLIGIYRPKGEP